MDSITQIVLGASVGEVVLGKKLKNRAAMWGAIAGTIPDLDVLANPFLDVVEELSFHRSISHSLLFFVIASPILAYFIQKIYKKEHTTYWEWVHLFFWGFFTHALLDTCTTWGTQLLYPFSKYGFATYTVFVIDPHYTIPLAVFLIAALTRDHTCVCRSRLNWIGISLSTGYLLLGFVLKMHVSDVFEKNLKEKEITYQGAITKVTPLNIWLWTTTVEAEDGYYSSFYSVFDKKDKVEFTFIPKNHELLEPYFKIDHEDKLKDLLYITKGYYTVDKVEKGYKISDLRFGSFNGWRGNGEGEFVFTYFVQEEDGTLKFDQRPYRFKPDDEYLSAYFDRVFSNLGKR